MSALHDTLNRLWFTSGHSDLWNCDSTYCPAPYQLLPKLDYISDDYSWLDDLPHHSFTLSTIRVSQRRPALRRRGRGGRRVVRRN